MHFWLQRYCSKGRRYLPQKSTNFTCSTLLLKKTPTRKIVTWQRLIYDHWRIDTFCDRITATMNFERCCWPLHLGLTQRWPQLRYSTRFLGIVSSPYWMSMVLITLAASSSKDGGLCVMSETNLTTRGLSLKDSWGKRWKDSLVSWRTVNFAKIIDSRYLCQTLQRDNLGWQCSQSVLVKQQRLQAGQVRYGTGQTLQHVVAEDQSL